MIQAAIGRPLLVLEEPIVGAMGDDDSAAGDPGRPSGVVGGAAAPPEICETYPRQPVACQLTRQVRTGAPERGLPDHGSGR